MAYATDHSVLFVTTPAKEEARKIAESVLTEKLVACVNMLDGVQSLFWWKDAVDKADEVLLVMKTRTDLIDRVIEQVRRLHPYEVPEVIALPIIAGNKEYLQWIDESVRKSE